MALKIANVGDIVVCVGAIYHITLGKKYRVLDTKGSTGPWTYYTIIDDTGKMFSSLYTSENFILEDEYDFAKNV